MGTENGDNNGTEVRGSRRRDGKGKKDEKGSTAKTSKQDGERRAGGEGEGEKEHSTNHMSAPLGMTNDDDKAEYRKYVETLRLNDRYRLGRKCKFILDIARAFYIVDAVSHEHPDQQRYQQHPSSLVSSRSPASDHANICATTNSESTISGPRVQLVRFVTENVTKENVALVVLLPPLK